MRKLKNYLLVALLFITASMFSQTKITGNVVDETNQPLPGASVVVEGTSTGVSTDFDGNFTLETSESSGKVSISFVGYETKLVDFNGSANLGTIAMALSAESLDEIVITGIADIAKDRKTPVAVSTIRASEIIEKLGSQEFPEMLKSTPSVYATKSGGGFGDARINIRGFDQANTAVMINGMPVNDMENGWVYWSNWAGLSDVTTAMQVQRGLGSSKLAISSVGGTINVITKTTDKKEGGAVSSTFGNDNYLKTMATYSTGKMESGFATSVLLSRTTGDGYVDGTEFEGYNYFIGFGLDKGDHNFQFIITGAPQVHNQRTTSFYNMATLANYLEYGDKYNYNHGYLNGKEFNWRKNFYHKPISSFNWDWKISDASKLSTVVYASVGRGGGTGDIGRPGGKYASDSRLRDDNGLVQWDKIVSSNGGVETDFGAFTFGNTLDPYTSSYVVNDSDLYSGPPEDDDDPRDRLDGIDERNGGIRRASMNSHNWFGAIVNFNTKLNDFLTLDAGLDIRSYKGMHYRRIDNLLGADGYRDNDDLNNPMNVLTKTHSSDLNGLWNVFKSIDDDEKIDYYNDGKVRWAGVFTQLEYSKDDVSLFIQGSVSQQGFKRIDYFNYLDNSSEQETDWENILGGNIKGGVNWNIDEKHNVFANAGYYTKQPLFDAIYINYVNDLNEDHENEKILGTEIGYGFVSEKFRLNLNLYRTSWKDRFITVDAENTAGDEGVANISGVEQVHTGAELEAKFKLLENVELFLMGSYGNWEYKGNPSGKAYDSDQNFIDDVTLYLDDVKVGDAAQFTARWGFDCEVFENFHFDFNQYFADNLYADISAEDFNYADHNGSLQLPAYNTMDLGISYKFEFKNEKSLNLRLNVNNVGDTRYIAESATNYHAETGDDTFRGIKTNNKVFFGFGRTWNASVRFNF